MQDPKRQTWLYLGVGLAAIVSAIYFLSTDNGQTGNYNILDWAILGMGVVAVYRGVRMFLELRRGSDVPANPGESTTFRRKVPRPGQDKKSKDA